MSLLSPLALTSLLLAGAGFAPPLPACESCPTHSDAEQESGAETTSPSGEQTAAASDEDQINATAEAPPSPLEESMETLKSALRKIKRGAYGDNLDESHVAQVDRAIAAVTTGSQTMPDAANTDALQQAYRQQMQAVLATLQTLKTAVKQSDAAQTKQILKQLDQQEDQGHEQFRPKEE